MIKFHKSLNINFLIIISFIILSFMSVIIMMHTHQFMGYTDDAFHLRRIIELKYSLSHGYYFPMLSFNQYHGSEIMSWYPYFNLYPIVLFSIFISSKIILIYIWFILNEFLSLFCSYYGCYSYNHSNYISYIFSVCYSLSMMFINIGLDDFGELTSMAVLPLVIFGCLNLIYYGRYLELSIGMILIIYSHVLSAIIAFVFIFIYILCNLAHLNTCKIINILKSFILIILLTSIVWMPVIILIIINKVSLYTPAKPFGHFNGIFAGNGIVNIFKIGLTNNSFNNLSFFAIIGLIISIALYKMMNSVLRKMFWISVSIIFICSDKFPWEYSPKFFVNFFKLFQIPDRFYILAQILLIYIFSVNIVKLINICNIQFIKNIIFCLLILFAIVLQVNSQYKIINQRINTPIISKQYFNDRIKGTKEKFFHPYRLNNSKQFKYILNSKYSPCYDYYPKDSINDSNVLNNYIIDNNGKRVKMHHIGFNEFSFKTLNNTDRIVLPLLCYNKHFLRVTINNQLSNFTVNKNNLITLTYIKKGYNKIKIQYVPNISLIILRNIMFIIGLIWISFILIKNYRKYKLREVFFNGKDWFSGSML